VRDITLNNSKQILAASIAALVLALPAFGQGMTQGMMSPPANVRPPGLKDVGIEQHLDEQIPPDIVFRDETGKSVRLADYFDLPAGGGLSYSLVSDHLADPQWNGLVAKFGGDVYNASNSSVTGLRVSAPYGVSGDLEFRVRISNSTGNVTSNPATLHVGTWAAPTILKPIPSFAVVRGERIIAALRLADYFSSSPWGEYKWNWHPTNYGPPWTSRLDINGGWLDITAGALNWTGELYGTIEACEDSIRCTPSNNFTVRFVDPEGY